MRHNGTNGPATVYFVQILSKGLIRNQEDMTGYVHSLGNKPSLSQDRQESSQVKSRTPEPDSTVQAGSLLKIAPEEYDTEGEENNRVIESICDPLPKCRFRKENVLLAEYIELRISVKDTS